MRGISERFEEQKKASVMTEAFILVRPAWVSSLGWESRATKAEVVDYSYVFSFTGQSPQ